MFMGSTELLIRGSKPFFSKNRKCWLHDVRVSELRVNANYLVQSRLEAVANTVLFESII